MSSDLLTLYGWQGLFIAVWVSLSIGSFLNVIIYRLPVMIERDWRSQARDVLGLDPEPSAEKFNLSTPRSRCPKCGQSIKVMENIPILSWLFLRGKCSICHASISWRYPGVELLTCLLTLTTLSAYGFTYFGLATCLLTWALIALTFIDYDTKLLPDQITIPLLWVGIFCSAFLAGTVPLPDAVIGAIAGYLFLWSTYWIFKLITGKEGMGYGDFKLFAALGAWLGWQALPSVILIAALSGLAYALSRSILYRQSAREPIPFGPFLAFAGWVTVVFRDSVLRLFLF